jgi:hypothetical protein
MSLFVRRLATCVALFFGGCSGSSTELPASSVAPSADVQSPALGILDIGADPAVVSVRVEGEPICAGALVAPSWVLTSRHCVSTGAIDAVCSDSSIPILRPPDSLAVFVTDSGALSGGRARVLSIVVPPSAGVCDADVALLELAQPIDTVAPLALFAQGAALGDHVRSVGFVPETSGPSGPLKWVRDHVAVKATTSGDLLLGEMACSDGCGGPAIDESSGEIVGVVSRAGPAGDVATRADIFYSFVAAQIALAGGGPPAAGAAKEKKGPVDMGAECVAATDCAAGVCVTDGARRYCSRSCSSQDHCPARYRCERTAQSDTVCVAT